MWFSFFDGNGMVRTEGFARRAQATATAGRTGKSMRQWKGKGLPSAAQPLQDGEGGPAGQARRCWRKVVMMSPE
jgi:hypothetical protein